MIGFLIYLPTLAFVPHLGYILSILYALYRYFENKAALDLMRKNYLILEVSIVFFIVLLSTINNVLGWGIESYFSSRVSFFFLFPFTILISLVLDRNDLKVLLVLVFVETMVVFWEYASGVSTFFTSLERFSEIGTNELWYYNKPLGLSLNSSAIALKLLIAFLLIDIIKIRGVLSLFLKFVFLLGIFMTFNRSVIVALVTFQLLKTLMYFSQTKLSSIRWVFIMMAVGSIFVICVSILFVYWDVLVNQMTRNTGKVELSGREQIWNYFLNFISENLFFGNHSKKIYWGDYHAHNSFLQLIANNGVLIALGYIYLIVRNIRKSNVIYVISILTYSFFQYGIFWGISLLDIIFFHLLLRFKRELKDTNGFKSFHLAFLKK